jgi:prepilin-type N-terminal cleavage/methylation domain-containing protein
MKFESNLEKNQKGFSLIELLVVAVLIGILTSATIVIINPATIRARGRDAQRISDLKTIQTALEQFYLRYRGYPSAQTSACSGTTCFIKISGSDRLTNCLITGGSCASVSNWVAVTNSIPTDPSGATGTNGPCTANSTQAYYYAAPYRASDPGLADGYVITAIMEQPSSVGGNTCNSTGTRNWGAFSLCAATSSNCYAVENK